MSTVAAELSPLLAVRDLDVAYGLATVLRGITLDVFPGEIVALVGANGAGKTTLLRTISGLLRPQRGGIQFAEREIAGLAAHERVGRGLAQAPEGRRIFTRMTVRENLLLGAYTSRDKRVVLARLDEMLALFPRLGERLDQRAGTLSGGEQQMLAIGRALMSKPRLLLLDEPSLGLAPIMVQAVFRLIKEINSAGTTILFVEQNAVAALSVCTRAYVLELGGIVREGNGAELLADPAIRNAYLGGE